MKLNHEYANDCLRYDIPLVAKSCPLEIINKLYTLSLPTFADQIPISTN